MLSLRGHSAAPDPREVVVSVLRQQAAEDTYMRAGFAVFDRGGRNSIKEFTYRRIVAAGESRTLVEFTAPAEIRGVALLSINPTGEPAHQYLYTPATQRVRTVAAQQRTARFLGTDFSFEDIQERRLADWSYQLLGDADLIDGHKTYKIQATPVSPADSQYKFIYLWIAQDIPVALTTEMYDELGTKVRTEHATQLKRVAGYWGARRTEVQTVREGTHTVLSISEVRFNTGMDHLMFTPEALEAASHTATAH
jgi:hypothetical protein